MISIDSKIKVTKGCRALGIDKGTVCRVRAVDALGTDYSHQVGVTLTFLTGFKAGTKVRLFGRHPNRMNDTIVRLNNGDPLKNIEIALV